MKSEDKPPKYLGGRIHVQYTRFGQLKFTEHNGRAVIHSIRIPPAGIKTLREYLKEIENDEGTTVS